MQHDRRWVELALWAAGAAAHTRDGHLHGTGVGTDAPTLPGMSGIELAAADHVGYRHHPGPIPHRIIPRAPPVQSGPPPTPWPGGGGRVPVPPAAAHPAFGGQFSVLPGPDDELHLRWQHGTEWAALRVNFASGSHELGYSHQGVSEVFAFS